MTVLGVVGAIAALAALAFVLAPLVRPEEELRSLDRPRSGVRDLAGSAADERTDGEAVARERRCPACGRAVGEPYDFCDGCVRPLPE